MTAESPMAEIAALIVDAGGDGLHACMQCGTCTGVCPWPIVLERFSPRAILREASLGLEGWEEELVWRCVTCRACVPRCPRGLEITEIMRAARAVLQESGGAPRSLSGPLASLRTSGNPWEGEACEREAWTTDLEVPSWSAACEALFMPCCTQVYDPRNRRASHAIVALLKHAGMAFGTLPGLQCCGDQARKVGAEEVYDALNTANLRTLQEHEAKSAIVSSPHCLDVLRRQDFAAEHITRTLARLVDEGALTPSQPLRETVTYHDPCYLGRTVGEYDAPRKLLTSIPGLDFREMPRHREDSLCCGGGGGGLWMDLPTEQRFAVHRVREALGTGATILATACPYCMLMFEDAIKVLELESSIRVLEVAEIVAHGVGLTPLAGEATP